MMEFVMFETERTSAFNCRLRSSTPKLSFDNAAPTSPLSTTPFELPNPLFVKIDLVPDDDDPTAPAAPGKGELGTSRGSLFTTA